VAQPAVSTPAPVAHLELILLLNIKLVVACTAVVVQTGILTMTQPKVLAQVVLFV
jgi:hypothetical protein